MKFILISGRRTALDPSFFFPFWLYSFFAPICHQPRTKRPFLMVRVEQLGPEKNFGHSASSLGKIFEKENRRDYFSGWLASNQHLVPNSDGEKKVDMSPKWSTLLREHQNSNAQRAAEARMWWPLPDCSFFFTTPPSVTGCLSTVCQRSILLSKNYKFLKSFKNGQFWYLCQNWLFLEVKNSKYLNFRA